MSATSYTLTLSSPLVAGVPATITLTPVGGAAPFPTLVTIFSAGSGAPLTFAQFDHFDANPVTVSITFPIAGTFTLYSTNSQSVADPYTSGSPLSFLVGVTTPEAAVRALLLENAAVTAITTSVTPMTDPQSVPRPRLTIARWGTDRSSETGGLSNDGSTGYAVAKMFVDSWADDQLTAKQLIDAARKALHGYSGTVAGFTLLAVVVADEREQPGALAPGQEKPVQRMTLDLRVSFGD